MSSVYVLVFYSVMNHGHRKHDTDTDTPFFEKVSVLQSYSVSVPNSTIVNISYMIANKHNISIVQLQHYNTIHPYCKFTNYS